MSGRLYDIATVARKLAVSKATVYRMIELGQIPVLRTTKKYGYKIPKRDLERFVESRKI